LNLVAGRNLVGGPGMSRKRGLRMVRQFDYGQDYKQLEVDFLDLLAHLLRVKLHLKVTTETRWGNGRATCVICDG
jgi:hypothetical protein